MAKKSGRLKRKIEPEITGTTEVQEEVEVIETEPEVEESEIVEIEAKEPENAPEPSPPTEEEPKIEAEGDQPVEEGAETEAIVEVEKPKEPEKPKRGRKKQEGGRKYSANHYNYISQTKFETKWKIKVLKWDGLSRRKTRMTRFEVHVDGETVGQFMERSGNRTQAMMDLRWEYVKGYISVNGKKYPDQPG